VQLETLSIDGLELLDSADYWIEQDGVDGLDEPDRRIASAVNPGSDGGFVASTLYGMRPVSITGALKRTASSTARKVLGETCQLRHDANGAPVLKVVAFSLDDGRSFTFQAEVARYKAPNLGTGPVEFSISLIAEDPLLYGADWQQSPNIVRSFGGGLIIPFISPAVAAGSSGGFGTVTNNGNEDAPVILELVGPLTSPYILNQTTGEFMQLNYTVPGGTVVLIDTHDFTILLQQGGSLIDKKAAGSSFFQLATGTNHIVFSTGSSSDTGYLRLRWRSASISI
jgi:hypothetical protein